MKTTWIYGIMALGLGGIAAAGCSTEAFCTDNCKGQTGTAASAAGGSGNDGGGGNGGTGGSLFTTTSTGGSGGGCVPTQPNEICNGLDDNCDGQVDEGIDFTLPQNCGTCATNCYTKLLNVDLSTITCDWSGVEGEAGTCAYTACADNYWNRDQNPDDCEYFCVQVTGATDDATCDNRDDDCDKVVDEDVDLCSDVDNCGKCGRACTVVHGTGQCVSSGQVPCSEANTNCQIASCNDDDADGNPDWWALPGAAGCWYHCSLTNGGVEICGDNLDNDCDGKIDGADDLSGDPAIGVQCFGDPDGICGTLAHAGTTQCVGGQVKCTGANVLVQNQTPESCNNLDDDCDGVVDDNATGGGVGNPCGVSSIYPCKLGTMQCLAGGVVQCVGAVLPGVESCNGQDDDCDGQIDLAGGNPPADSVGACDVPVPPPAGATSPCMAGALACVGGVVACQGAVGPSSANDGCGDDSNCDGVLTGQPDLQTDVSNCNACGNDCYAGSQHSVWACQAGACVWQGCQPGYHNVNGQCDYGPCYATGAEQCNNLDDDCDGQIDNGVAATPTPVQVCGVSPAASRPECTTAVQVTCTNGTWACNFQTPGVCSPSCAATAEICDGLDNDCDGSFNENVSNYGQSCNSDDGLPAPGHGACRTSGTFVCSGPNATACSAVKANCAGLPGGCTELCDGVDNDCDGVVDEAFNNKGSNATYFVKPVATKISATRWAYSYEASRPTASGVSAGAGNGYHCTAATCPGGIPAAPAGVALERTRACSVSGRLPWFNVTPTEAEQTCNAMGGFVCATTDWQTACQTTSSCTWGYNPRGAACTSAYTGTKYCNLGPSYDFSSVLAGDQDGLLPVASAALQNCWGDWSGLQGNTATTNKLYDVTGNLREITKSGVGTYPLMGGAFDTATDAGATCTFNFYVVDQLFALYDTGFRCCFSADPTL